MRATFFHVTPRYTAGSPGVIREERYAKQLAADEKRCHAEALTGVYGESDKLQAERLGLRGIVQEKREKGSGKKHGWEVHDLCTGETLFQLCTEALAKLGWRRYPELEDHERACIDQAPPPDLQKHKDGWYKFEFVGFPKMWNVTAYRPEVISRPEDA